MSGQIKRMQGEKFSDFLSRQQAAQKAEKIAFIAAIKNQKMARKIARNRNQEVSDFDYSMNY